MIVQETVSVACHRREPRLYSEVDLFVLVGDLLGETGDLLSLVFKTDVVITPFDLRTQASALVIALLEFEFVSGGNVPLDLNTVETHGVAKRLRNGDFVLSVLSLMNCRFGGFRYCSQ